MEKARIAGKSVVGVAAAAVAAAVVYKTLRSRTSDSEDEEAPDFIDTLSQFVSGQRSLIPEPIRVVVAEIQSNRTLRSIYDKINSSARLKGFSTLVASSVALWGVSLILKDVSFIDSFWSLGFLLLTFVYRRHYTTREGGEVRKDLILATTAFWAVRLSTYLTWRNHGLPEDFRYQAMRKASGSIWWIKSLFQVFILQAVLCFAVSQPLLAAQLKGTDRFTMRDKIGVVLWAIGFFFESVGDFQLASFKRNPANKGKLLTTGLWKYTRHPNYFGNACMFWGFWIMATAVKGGWMTIYSPILMTYLLMKVSGVPMLERSLSKRKPGFEKYMATTNTFFPWFPSHA